MRVAATFVIAFCFFCALSSCAKSEQRPTGASVQPVLPAAETGPYTVIGHMEHRDRIVTIKTGQQGTVYSVQSKDGKILFENLTAEQLKTRSPEIHGFIEAAEAGSADLMPGKVINAFPDASR